MNNEKCGCQRLIRHHGFIEHAIIANQSYLFVSMVIENEFEERVAETAIALDKNSKICI
jgi:hypothetical protein